MSLTDWQKNIFETLRQAGANEDLALMECRDKQTGKMVGVICAVNVENEEYEFVPLAIVPDGNPYDRFEPPIPSEN